MSFSVLLFDCDSVDVVVSAERYDFQVRRDVVDYASSNAIDIEVI